MDHPGHSASPWALQYVLFTEIHFLFVNQPYLGLCLSLCPGADPKNSLQGFRSFSTCILGSVLSTKIYKAPLCCSIYAEKGINHPVDRVELSFNLSLGLELAALAVCVEVLTKGEKSCYKHSCYLFKRLETFIV